MSQHATSFNASLGFRPGPDDTILFEPRPEHQVMPGVVHFALLTTLAEVSAAHSVQAAVVPASVHVQLMRRASLDTLVGKGTLLKRGRRVAFAEGEVRQNGELVAKASVQFALLA